MYAIFFVNKDFMNLIKKFAELNKCGYGHV